MGEPEPAGVPPSSGEDPAPGSLSRRALLVGGTAGTVGALVGRAPASAADASEPVGSWTTGEVVRSTTDAARVEISAGDRVIRAAARDFPQGWTFTEGDIVAVNVASAEALPFFAGSPRTTPSGSITHTMPNVDRARDRIVSRRGG